MPPNEGELAVLQAQISLAPLPPPDDLKRYEETLPGTADRLITMMEIEQEKRLEEEQRGTTARIAAERRAQWFGFGIAITGLIVAGTSAIHEAFVTAITIAVCSTSGGGLFTWLLRDRRQ